MAQLTFAYNPRAMTEVPANARELAAWAEAHPGRITYPTPENWIGASFLKQVLLEVTPDRQALLQPVEAVDFEAATQPLWSYLEALHPYLWRAGREFPRDEVQQRTMLADGEVDFSITFNAGETSGAIEQGILPPHIRTFVFGEGTLGNTHFVLMPFNANAKEGAMVIANILLEPEVQADKLSPATWGDGTVLDVAALSPELQAFFEAVPAGEATLSPEELGTPLPEPHYSWGPALTRAWLERFRAR